MRGLMPTTSQNAAPPFALFGGDHFAALAVIAAVATLLIITLRGVGRMRQPAVRRAVCWSLATLLLGNFVYAEIYWIRTGTWSIHHAIPLHLCDMAHFVAAAALFAAGSGRLRPSSERARSRWSTVFELAYYWGLAGTVQALLTPDLGVSFPHPEFFRFFGGHGTIVAGVLVLVVGIGIRPRPWSALRVWAITNAIAPPVMLFNWLTKSNYMFLCGPPANSSIYDYFGRWPWSLITLDIVALSMMTLCYLPFWVLNRRARRS